MSQKNINCILSEFESPEELREVITDGKFVRLTPEEKNAFRKIDIDACELFVKSSDIRRINSRVDINKS